ncbi:MAG: deoxyribodipyrimidine photo-lyase [Thermodesulfobacteriota bacterium]
MHRRTIFWFRRDLRVKDNTGLYHAVRESPEVIPIVIFDENILENLPDRNLRLGFIIEATKQLKTDLLKLGSDLLVLKGKPSDLIPKIAYRNKVDAVYVNKAYSVYGRRRDNELKEILEGDNIEFSEFEDTLLVEPERIPQRKVFTPFYKLWSKTEKRPQLLEIRRINSPKLDEQPFEKVIKRLSFSTSSKWPINFPEERLNKFDFSNYMNTRNYPYINGTSRLSPYIRFGIVSIRQIYSRVRSETPKTETYISELAWREFWYHIMHYFPETIDLEFQEKRRNIKWISNDEWYEAWKEGRTGYPIVDAGMRQLKEEGWIHNRVRMIVASFLTKDLLIDWRMGDRHFFDYLIDYDEAVDIGNWQWVASVGADPKPLRIFNPILQSKWYDPDCKYIKKYVSELKDIDPGKIHDPLKYDLSYHAPIVNHYEMSSLAKEKYNE